MIYEPINILLFFLFALQNGVNSFTIYDARLGSSLTSRAASGRVEVLTQRGWMPVCAYSWDASDSGVLCRQLGYDYSSYSRSSSSVNTLLFYYFYCSGSESSISQCHYTFSYERQTSCSSIVTVNCDPCTNGGVRLRGGIVPEAGTVEYCTGGTWKAVCDNSWDYKDSFVVCRQLGLPATDAVRYQNSYFGVHPFPSTTYFNCFGNETSLSSCQSSTSSSLCGSEDAAGVYCKGDIITELCVVGHLRLVGGSDANEGRVEICSNGVWGTINYGSWDSLDARVVCRQLGLYQTYSRVEVFRSNSYFGAGSGPVLFANLNCNGTESTLNDCSYSSYYFTISHSDAGVRCFATATQSGCSNGDVRLVNGTTSYEGRVEICYNGVWGSVCDSGWDSSDAIIVCRQMGFQRINATALRSSYFGDGVGPYHLSNLDCSGEERTLLQCSYGRSTVGYHTCSPGHDAGVKCDVSTTCNHGEVRLFGGYTKNDGIAEVCVGGQWADICYSGVMNRTNAARVFCRQLIGQEPRVYASSCCARQRNAGNVTLYNINCNDRSRDFVQDCAYSIVMEYNTAPASGCTLQNKLIVECYEQSVCTVEGDLRLRGGNSTHQGRVELCSQGIWGTIVSDFFYFWSSREAMVVCRQLGYPREWASIFDDIFGRGNLPTFSADLSCSGTEQRLSQCLHSSVRISQSRHYRSVFSVICQGNTSAPTECKHGDVRLVDGHNKAQGRVEICAYGNWAIPCDSSWNIIGTEIVCKQLDLPTSGSMYKSGSPFDSNYQLPIISISCGTGVTNISECLFTTQFYYYGSCNHRNTMGIYCQEREEQYYFIKVDTLPAQENYEIGSQVTFNCTVSPAPVYEPSSIAYEWYSSVRGGLLASSPRSTLVTTIPAYHTDSADYYCQPLHNGRLLGRGKITLKVKDILQRNVTGSSDGSIQVQEQGTIILQVKTTPINALNGLLNLMWYLNDVIIKPNCDARFTLSNNNKTLTISNFTSSYAGIYKAQFDQLFVHPFDDICRDEVLSLMRHLPILRPAVFCVNMNGNCSDVDLKLQKREISVRPMNQDLQGTLSSINLEATGRLLTSKELAYSYIQWYRSGSSITSSNSLSTLQRQCNNLTLGQGLQLINATYEHSGRYEVLLRMRMSSYLQAGSSQMNCQPYYNRFVSYYFSSEVTLAKGFVDIDYHKALIFDLNTDKKATTRDEGATLTCRASIEFPPFSTLSLIKNGQIVATSLSGLLLINTRSVDTNPFGVYTCQLNASGEIFQKCMELKEQVSLKLTMSGKNCIKSAIEDALVLKIGGECRCNFNKSDLLNSNIECKGNNELTYTATLEYSSDNGSETASVIAERIVRQLPFSMVVGGSQLTVTSACTDCENTAKASLSTAAGGGLFIGGFAAAILIALTLVIIVILAMKRYRYEGKGERRVEVRTDPLRYATAGAARQDVDLSFKGPAAEYMTPHPKKPSEYQAIGPRDQPSQYETMQFKGEQPIYEETF